MYANSKSQSRSLLSILDIYGTELRGKKLHTLRDQPAKGLIRNEMSWQTQILHSQIERYFGVATYPNASEPRERTYGTNVRSLLSFCPHH
jgi:hypothetical protein